LFGNFAAFLHQKEPFEKIYNICYGKLKILIYKFLIDPSAKQSNKPINIKQ
jgi:hypothetical protein